MRDEFEKVEMIVSERGWGKFVRERDNRLIREVEDRIEEIGKASSFERFSCESKNPVLRLMSLKSIFVFFEILYWT